MHVYVVVTTVASYGTCVDASNVHFDADFLCAYAAYNGTNIESH